MKTLHTRPIAFNGVKLKVLLTVRPSWFATVCGGGVTFAFAVWGQPGKSTFHIGSKVFAGRSRLTSFFLIFVRLWCSLKGVLLNL